jgi:hypothetical protein
MEIDAIGTLITQLISQYGLTGLAFGAFLWLLWRSNQRAEAAKVEADARITELEKKQNDMYEEQAVQYKEMINEYVGLVQNKIEVLSKLTSCINVMNTTLTQLADRGKDKSQ